MDHMIRNNFSKEQHGFIGWKLCIAQFLEFLDDLTEVSGDGKGIDVIHLDFVRHLTKCLTRYF